MLVQTSPALTGHAFPRLKLRYKPSLVQVRNPSCFLFFFRKRIIIRPLQLHTIPVFCCKGNTRFCSIILSPRVAYTIKDQGNKVWANVRVSVGEIINWLFQGSNPELVCLKLSYLVTDPTAYTLMTNFHSSAPGSLSCCYCFTDEEFKLLVIYVGTSLSYSFLWRIPNLLSDGTGWRP